MMAASSSGELRAIADRLRRGELGESHRWLEIEAKLGGEGWEVGVDDLRAFATSPDPLRFVLVQGRIPPFDSTRDSPIRAWGEGAIQRHHLRQIDEVGCAAGDPWVRRMVAQLFFELVETFPTPAEPASEEAWPSVDDVIRLLHTAETPVVLETMAALCHPLGPREVTAILANTMTPIVVASYRSTPKPATSLVQILEEALLSSPGSPRLQQALLKVLDFEASHGRAPVVNIHAAGDSADARLLRLLSGHAALEDLQALGRLLSVTGMSVSFALLDAHESSRPFVLPLIEALLALPETSTRLRSEAVDFLAERIASGTVGLASPDQWTAAGLPAPPPMTHHTERPELPGAHIASVEINNLRAFPQRFEVSAPVPAGPGQWMVFLGENATGKTTLLRAVAMALASPSDAAAVPSNVEGPLRRDASRDGFVLVRTRDGRDLTTTITGPGADERIVVTPEDALRPWVVGYGCRRGSAIGGTDMDNAFVPFRDLDNLFDRERGVIRASGWLKELQRLARNNGKRSRDIYEAARKALCGALLGAESIVVENDVSVVFEGNRRVPLALLSDGYLTTAGWIVDLMARWLKRNEGRKTVDDTFCAAMEGVVLLDEIDLHLHPRWQERVIEDVRSLFPRMTFIATTHHPLTLRGARKGEVFVLGDHDGSGAISALQRDIPPGTRVDELLTGEWFNRPSAIVDEETRRMLDEHQRLILAGAKAGTPERKALETKLRERLGRFADTSLERLAATIVAQHLDASLPEPSAQQRERVRQEVLKILQRRDKKRG
jgi:energy-coupling factor transporter ATP-binding protein EcfA2